MLLSEILKDSNYKLTQFEKDAKAKVFALEESIILKDIAGKLTPYITCLIRKKEIKLTTLRVGRTLNLIAGDGQKNVLHLNTLDYGRWDEKIDDDEDRKDIYYEGWKKLKKLRTDKNSNQDFQFDILMANPPFAGVIKESHECL
ncbi:DNA methyltransferase family protein [Arcticibacter eurypsychrophilus]|uniref:hypothetical protein n=1 Tax=Arcticibacter eurypsychrophilus TaxID=1434752 RepID=UPI00084DA4AD|nr:hypothetical protein [Arcticibacter eurypsychrophilus]